MIHEATAEIINNLTDTKKGISKQDSMKFYNLTDKVQKVLHKKEILDQIKANQQAKKRADKLLELQKLKSNFPNSTAIAKKLEAFMDRDNDKQPDMTL